MTDKLISLNAAIDAMMKLQIEDIEAYGASIPEGFDGDRAVTALKALPSAQPGWIPWDSGGFPEESGTYTVTAYDGATKRVTYAKYQKRLKRWELTGSRAYWKVLAWQPLPTPYREGGQDDSD